MSNHIGLVNCAECGMELVGERSAVSVPRPWPSDLPPAVRGRIMGRPYCSGCLTCRVPPARATTTEDDGGPWQQNAVREMEEDSTHGQ